MKTIFEQMRSDLLPAIAWCSAFWLVYLAVLYATSPELL